MAKNDYLRQSEGVNIGISYLIAKLPPNTIIMCSYECTKPDSRCQNRTSCPGPEEMSKRRRNMGGYFYFAGTG
ncbi:MAG: hypothetical protein GTN43_04245 [Candidatus Aenigmarchaeota archaeon]|nr:hypothetical protein [Candidatus Aenigmarchaeota archaeon]